MEKSILIIRNIIQVSPKVKKGLGFFKEMESNIIILQYNNIDIISSRERSTR